MRDIKCEEYEEICPLCCNWIDVKSCPCCNGKGKINWIDQIKNSEVIKRARIIRELTEYTKRRNNDKKLWTKTNKQNKKNTLNDYNRN